jgi:hypothetical protein
LFTGRNRDLFGLESLGKVENTEDYLKQSNSSQTSNLQHFFDKLLRIHTMLITDEGKKLGINRHKAMLSFLRELANELCDADCEDGRILKSLLAGIESV